MFIFSDLNSCCRRKKTIVSFTTVNFIYFFSTVDFLESFIDNFCLFFVIFSFLMFIYLFYILFLLVHMYRVNTVLYWKVLLLATYTMLTTFIFASITYSLFASVKCPETYKRLPKRIYSIHIYTTDFPMWDYFRYRLRIVHICTVQCTEVKTQFGLLLDR